MNPVEFSPLLCIYRNNPTGKEANEVRLMTFGGDSSSSSYALLVFLVYADRVEGNHPAARALYYIPMTSVMGRRC